MIYLAPLQGFTDFIFRKVYNLHFQGIDAYFIPYLTIKNGVIPPKELREILPENNLKIPVVPQILVKDVTEFESLAGEIQKHNYQAVNINMGCPYPMVTRQGRGSGLLPFPGTIKSILDVACSKKNLAVSVKLRTGLVGDNEIEEVINVLNKYPLSEIIYHPRLASQMFTGQPNNERFQWVVENSKHSLVYNGDIVTIESFENLRKLFPSVQHWMIGRGVLMNPFLPMEIAGNSPIQAEKRMRLKLFHDELSAEYLKTLSTPGHVVDKMRPFWSYFSQNFTNPHKTFKRIKKAKSFKAFQEATTGNFADYL